MADFVEDDQNNGPKPLSSEAPSSAEIEIDPKKKPSDKKTIINFRDKNYIRKTVETPKEPSAQNNNEPPPTSSSTSAGTGRPSDNLDDIRRRLSSEPQEPQALSSSVNSGGGGSDAEAPDQDDCDMYAEMAIELIDWVMIMLIQWYAKDPKEDEYKSDEKKKTRLKKMLGKMLMKMGKKYPIGVFFFGALILMYVPAARKAHTHKQQVDTEKAEQAAREAAAAEAEESRRSSGDSGSGSSGSKRRRLKQDPEIQDGNLEEN